MLRSWCADTLLRSIFLSAVLQQTSTVRQLVSWSTGVKLQTAECIYPVPGDEQRFGAAASAHSAGLQLLPLLMLLLPILHSCRISLLALSSHMAINSAPVGLSN